MKIFYIDTNKFPKNKIYDFAKNNNFLEGYSDKEKLLQHYGGLYLLDYVAKTFYGIKNSNIYYKNKKPYFRSTNLFFSISHSKNIIGIVFDNDEVGFDIEYNQQNRNFYKILKRFSKALPENYFENFEKNQKEMQKNLFYDFWTTHEAKIKLNSNNKNIFLHTEILCNNFTYSIASEKPFFLDKIIVLDE